LQAEKGKHAPGYKKEWECDFTWLEPVRNSESSQVVGRLCSTFPQPLVYSHSVFLGWGSPCIYGNSSEFSDDVITIPPLMGPRTCMKTSCQLEMQHSWVIKSK